MANTTELSHVWRDLPLHVVYQTLEHLTDLAIAECTFSDDFPSDPLFMDFDTMDTSAMLQVNPTVTADRQVVDHHDTDSEHVKFFLHEPFLRSYHNRVSILYAVVLDGQADALLDLVTGAWERIVANDGSSVGTYTFGVGIRKPRLLEFQETWASDFVRSWTLAFDVEGLDIMNEGRQIQFRWKRLMTKMMEFLRDLSALVMENPPVVAVIINES